MTAVTVPPAGRPWRLLRIGVLNELAYRARLVITPTTLAFQVFLYDRLWTAVFRHTTTSAGMDLRQTVSYSLIALLLARIRWNFRTPGIRDSLSVALREGTVVYWFLRPVAPSRFYLLRQTGDMVYGAVWAIGGYTLLLATGVIDPPRSVVGAVVFVVSAVLGQLLFLFLGQLVDLSLFWLMTATFIVRAYSFAQDLLAGVFIPLAFMPTVLRVGTQWLPFSFCVNVPLSLYIGRIPVSDAPIYLAGQLAWLAALAVTGHLLWSRARQRLTVHGG
jgi:ABC-2 type transport system permease protein